MSQELNLNQDQRLQQRLTPLQVQYVRMLEMTAPEVEDVVARSLDENPALVRTDEPSQPQEESAEQIARADYAGDEDSDEAPTWHLEAPSNSAPRPEVATPDNDVTLAVHLIEQLPVMALTQRQTMIARWLINSADDNGYLRRTPRQLTDEIAVEMLGDVTEAEVTEVLDKLRHSLEPHGVLAADLRQCLLLQIHDTASLAYVILDRYYDLFANKHYPQLISRLKVDEGTFASAQACILRLDPKPGAAYTQARLDEAQQYIIPDITADVEPTDRVTLSLASASPELALEQSFDLDDAQLQSLRPPERAFIHQRAEEARNIIRLLKMRNDTLLRVARALAHAQRRFFLTENAEDIVPLGLKDIAAATGLDMSVVSRATSAKYISLPGGIYPMKMFFTMAVTPKNDTPDIADSDAVVQPSPAITGHTIEASLRRLIDNEDKAHPYSDQKLAEIMSRQEHIDIARRTITKYRERLDIPAGRLRRTLSGNKSIDTQHE